MFISLILCLGNYYIILLAYGIISTGELVIRTYAVSVELSSVRDCVNRARGLSVHMLRDPGLRDKIRFWKFCLCASVLHYDLRESVRDFFFYLFNRVENAFLLFFLLGRL